MNNDVPRQRQVQYAEAQVEIAVLDALSAGKRQASTITAHSGMDEKSVRAALKSLKCAGVVTSTKHKKIELRRFYIAPVDISHPRRHSNKNRVSVICG